MPTSVKTGLAGGHGIELLEEAGGGDLTGTVKNSNSAANEAFGVFGDETGAGTGAVTLSNVTFVGAPNGVGNTGGNAIVPGGLISSACRVDEGPLVNRGPLSRYRSEFSLESFERARYRRDALSLRAFVRRKANDDEAQDEDDDAVQC